MGFPEIGASSFVSIASWLGNICAGHVPDLGNLVLYHSLVERSIVNIFATLLTSITLQSRHAFVEATNTRSVAAKHYYIHYDLHQKLCFFIKFTKPTATVRG